MPHSINIFPFAIPLGPYATWKEMLNAFDIEKQLKIPPTQSGQSNWFLLRKTFAFAQPALCILYDVSRIEGAWGIISNWKQLRGPVIAHLYVFMLPIEFGILQSHIWLTIGNFFLGAAKKYCKFCIVLEKIILNMPKQRDRVEEIVSSTVKTKHKTKVK